MGNARLEISVGNLRFSCEGSEDWVGKRFSDVSKYLEKPVDQGPQRPAGNAVDKGPQMKAKPAGTLATFIRENGGNESQVKRFLVAAVWLQSSGAQNLKTNDVTKALTEARQQPLNNPADVLNQNVAKGFCVKAGNGFYVTPEGEASLKL